MSGRWAGGRPVLLGFQAVSPGMKRSQVWSHRRLLAAYARREGFRLGRVFVQYEGRPGTALRALIAAAHCPEVSAVAVVSLADLGASGPARVHILQQLEARAGVPVRIVQRVPR